MLKPNNLRLPFCAIAAITLFVTWPAQAEEPLRVMSFNIRYGSANDGDNHWDKRKDLVVESIAQFSPDLLGTQETLKFQAEYLEQQLGAYTYFGRSRMKSPNEHCGIFYRTERFTWLAGGHFWLSETPEAPESISWDSSLPRMASWVLLQDRKAENSQPTLFINTHFDHRGATARTESARLIRARIAKLADIAQHAQLVVTGDFNTGEGSAPYEALLAGNEQLRDTYRAIHTRPQDHEGTFNGWQGIDSGPRIDWILASPSLAVQDAAIVRFSRDGHYPSDHFPVTAILQP